MEQLSSHERKEKINELSNIEVREILLGNETRAVIMPHFAVDIEHKTGWMRDPDEDQLSIFKTERGLSNYGPMGPDTLLPEVEKHFRMMRLDEIMEIVTSERREVSAVRAQLLIAHVFETALYPIDTKIDPHNGGWGGIMTNHAIRIKDNIIELADYDELNLERSYSYERDKHNRLFSTNNDATIEKYDLTRLKSKTTSNHITLKQLDKSCPDFTERLFSKEFEELPQFVQTAYFDIPKDSSLGAWSPLSLSLTLRLEKPQYSDAYKLSHGAIKVSSACIGTINNKYAGWAWFIDKHAQNT